MDNFEEYPPSDTFISEVEKFLDNPKKTITDFEWKLHNHKWEEQKMKDMNQMYENPIWSMLFTKHQINKQSAYGIGYKDTTDSNLSPNLDRISKPSRLRRKLGKDLPKDDTKQKKQRRLKLFKFFDDWDTASFAKRDQMTINFIRENKTSAKIHDSDHDFINGGSLIFCRFVVGMQICNLKHRKVWHYYDAMGILVRSLQGDHYTEEFLRLGGMNFIINIIRGEECIMLDKLHSCRFLLDIMEGRNGHIVKQFICASPHFLETLIDSLTMCKDQSLIDTCGMIFQNLCIEIPPENIALVCNYVMHALPCDFNPMLQSMAFKVLQSLVRLKPSLSTKCIKPILDNLKNTDRELLSEMSNLSLVILQTKYGDELINSLMVAGEGIQLREVYRSEFRQKSNKSQSVKESVNDMKRAREKRDKNRAKQLKSDHFMHQAGALFVLNKMITSRVDFVNDFVNKGILGLSLKTLGACPHWEVQGQGVTMVQYLLHSSPECAAAYFIMLPQKMLSLIMEHPEICLRYFTSPICVFLRKLGRFALRMWPRFLEKVIIPARVYSKGTVIPHDFFETCQMARKVREIHKTMGDLLESPVMEATSLSPKEIEADTENEEYVHDFLESSDEENLAQYKTGKAVVMEDARYEPFKSFMDNVDYQISEDRLDTRVDVNSKRGVLTKAGDEMDAYQIAILEDAQKKTLEKAVMDHPDEQNSEWGGEDISETKEFEFPKD